MKSGSFKRTSEIKNYRSYKKFELESFNRILKDKLENLTSHYYAEFGKVFLNFIKKEFISTSAIISGSVIIA